MRHFIPSWTDIIWLLVMLALGVLLGNLVSLPLMKVLDPQNSLQYATLVSYPLQFLPAVIYAAVQGRKPGRGLEGAGGASVGARAGAGVCLDRNGFRPFGGALCALLCAVGIIVAAYVCDPLTLLLPPMPEFLKNALESMTQGSLWVNLLCVSVMAPICEEWLCRGIVLRGLLANGKKPWVAILFSAFFFAFIHMNPWQAIPAFIVGCLMGYVYYKTGSLKLTMLMHCVNNTSSVLLSRVPGWEDMETWQDVLPQPYYWLIFAGCALLLALILLTFRKIQTISWKVA